MIESISVGDVLQWVANLAVLAVIGLFKMHNKLRSDFEACKQDQAKTYMPREEAKQLVHGSSLELREDMHRLADKVDRIYELLINKTTGS